MDEDRNQRDAMMDLGHERPQVPVKARNRSPIVPRASIAGRASQTSLQREHRTVRPAAPKVAKSMA